jgi:hypothetical protein
VNKLTGAILLYVLAAFMLLGFISSGMPLSASAIAALLITVALPAGIATRMLATRNQQPRIDQHKHDLRMRTIEAEILRIATPHKGKLTLIEMVSELAISPEEAKTAADSLVRQELADIEITESGVLVYAFHDIKHLHEKPSSRGILE